MPCVPSSFLLLLVRHLLLEAMPCVPTDPPGSLDRTLSLTLGHAEETGSNSGWTGGSERKRPKSPERSQKFVRWSKVQADKDRHCYIDGQTKNSTKKGTTAKQTFLGLVEELSTACANRKRVVN